MRKIPLLPFSVGIALGVGLVYLIKKNKKSEPKKELKLEEK